MSVKQKIIQIKTQAVLEAVKQWIEDNGIIIDQEKHPLENYIKIVIAEME